MEEESVWCNYFGTFQSLRISHLLGTVMDSLGETA